MIIESRTIILKNSKELILRSVRPGEAQLMLDHLIISHGESYQNLNRGAEYWKNLGVEEEEKVLKAVENSPKKFFLGAFDQGKIVACQGVFGTEEEVFNNRTAMIGMSIQNKYGNLGLGTKMMEYALDKCQEMGLHRMELTVRTYNTHAISLYEKMGFRRIGTLTDTAFIDGKFVNEYAYEKIL